MKNGTKIELGFNEGKITNLFAEKIHNQEDIYLVTKDKQDDVIERNYKKKF